MVVLGKSIRPVQKSSRESERSLASLTFDFNWPLATGALFEKRTLNAIEIAYLLMQPDQFARTQAVHSLPPLSHV